MTATIPCLCANTSTSYDGLIDLLSFDLECAKDRRVVCSCVNYMDRETQWEPISHMHTCYPIQKRVSYSNCPSQTHVETP